MSDLEDLRQQRVAKDKTRLRDVIMKLRRQVKNPAVLDQFLSNLNPTTAIDGRLPLTPKRVITVPNKTACLHNLLAWAVIHWGFLARGEAEDGNPQQLNPELVTLEQIADTKGGFAVWGAYPKDRNSSIHVLRTAVAEKQVRADRAAAVEKAREMKLNLAVSQTPAEPTGLEQEEPDGEDVSQVVAGGRSGVAGAAQGSSPDGAVAPEAGEQSESPEA